MVIMGTNPASYKDKSTSNTTVEQVMRRQRQIELVRRVVQEALNQSAGHTPEGQYKEGDIVWLDARNLPLAVPTAKLAPK